MSAFEALLLVVVGVVAARLSGLILVLALAVIVGLVVLIRWMNAAPARIRESSTYLWHRYEQRGLLLDDLQEIVSHLREERWRFRELVGAVRWWFDEDLLTDWWAERDMEQDARRGSKGSGIRLRRSLRARLSGVRYRVKRSLEGMMTRRPQLIDAVYRAGNEEVARIVLARAIAEGFVCEHLEHPHRHRAEITYSLSPDILQAPAEGE